MKICVYCASRPVSQANLDLATELGSLIGGQGHTLVSGGGRVSMMGAVARAARAAGGHTVGVIPRALMDREVADTDADELIVTDTMRQRKQVMDDHSDAFIVLPGGIGTLEELFETWTAGYLGMHSKPIAICDPAGHYAGLHRWFNDLQESGFVTQVSLSYLSLTTTPAAALTACMSAIEVGNRNGEQQ